MNCRKLSSLAWCILELEQSQFTIADCAAATKQLHDLIETAHERGVAKLGLIQQIECINRLLFREKRFRFRSHDRNRAITLMGTLIDLSGNCLGLTTLYMSIATHLGIAVRALLYETHITVCIEKHGRIQPIEVSRGGIMLRGRIKKQVYGDSGNFRVLNDEQLLAVQLSNRAAFVYAPLKAYTEAVGLLDRAIRTFPEYTPAWINLAAIFLRMNDSNRAARTLERVFDLSPSRSQLRQAIEMMDCLVTGKIPADYHVL
jgi:regulator of sirC expression with transglutaminase-like and TPR domain